MTHLCKLITICMPVVCGAGSVCANSTKLNIYLPRTANINSETARVSEVTVLSGDPNLIESAGAASVGKVVQAGGQITVDRTTILSMLASRGIYADDIALSGADSVIVKRQGYRVPPDDIKAVALETLQKQIKNAQCRWKAAWEPKEFIADGSKSDVTLTAAVLNSLSQSRQSVMVSILVKGKQAVTRQVDFDSTYTTRRAVTITDVAMGSMLTTDNTRIDTFETSYPQQAGWTEPYGLAAKRPLRANTVISAEMLEVTKSPMLVTRNQGVVIQIKQPGLTITAMGEALQDGRVREYIKVRNIDSQKVLIAKVNDDGTVEPAGNYTY